jgi:large subunit ribosomal protein L33
MAKAATIKIKLLSTADTGYFYVTKKNARTKTEKLSLKKYEDQVIAAPARIESRTHGKPID